MHLKLNSVDQVSDILSLNIVIVFSPNGPNAIRMSILQPNSTTEFIPEMYMCYWKKMVNVI